MMDAVTYKMSGLYHLELYLKALEMHTKCAGLSRNIYERLQEIYYKALRSYLCLTEHLMLDEGECVTYRKRFALFAHYRIAPEDIPMTTVLD